MMESGQPFGKMLTKFEDRRIQFSCEREEQYQDIKIPLEERLKPQKDMPIELDPDTQATFLKPPSEPRLPGISYFLKKIGLNDQNQEQPKPFGEMTLDHDESLNLAEMLGVSQIFQEIGKESDVQDGVSGLRRDLDDGEGAEST